MALFVCVMMICSVRVEVCCCGETQKFVGGEEETIKSRVQNNTVQIILEPDSMNYFMLNELDPNILSAHIQ